MITRVILSSLLSAILFSSGLHVVHAASADYDSQLAQALALEKSGNRPAAIDLYRELIAAQPQRAEAYNNLASLLVQEGDYSGAQQWLEKAMKLDPVYSVIHQNLSNLYIEMARDSYGKALRLPTGEAAFQLSELSPPASRTQTTAMPARVESAAVPVAAQAADTDMIAAQNKADILTTLQGWAAAWSEQATDVYLDFYAQAYHPAELSRQNWRKERRQKLQRPDWIKVKLDNIQITLSDHQQARVELIQDYRASNYQDRTRKALLMQRTADGWRITGEQTLAVLN